MKTLKKSENKWSFLSISKERKKVIHREPRKDRSRLLALEYIDYKQINNLPINLKDDFYDVFEDYEWIVITYDEAKKYLNVPDPLNIRKKKALARTILRRGTTVFLTVYVENAIYPKQDYYTVAHELGHIILGHFFEFQSTALSRGGLTNAQYVVLEREAETFAAEFIMPMPVLKNISIKSYKDIVNLCGVTKSSAQIRVKEMLNFQITRELFPFYNNIKTLFHNFVYKKYCLKCNSHFISENSRHCPICGHSRITRGDGKMIYKGYALDERGRALGCPVCDNEQMATDGAYCKVCGIYLINKCTNYDGIYEENEFGNFIEVKPPCGMIAEGNARYCELCGEPTTFYKNQLLKPWQIIESEERVAASSEYNSIDDGDIPF